MVHTPQLMVHTSDVMVHMFECLFCSAQFLCFVFPPATDCEQMNLTRLNWFAAAAHTTAAVLSMIFLKSKSVPLFKTSFDASVPATSDIDFPQQLVPSGTTVNIKSMTIAFFFITAIAHVVYATDFFGKGWYTSAVFGFGWNPFRWFEYSITAAIMIFIISVIAGNKDNSVAWTVSLITVGLMFQGYTNEREIHQNLLAKDFAAASVDPYIVWGNFIPAWLLYGIKWYLIFNALVTLQKDIKQQTSGYLDGKVTWLVLLQFAFFTCFGIVQSVQVYMWARRVQPSVPYLNFEVAYVALSLIAKVGLGLSVANLLN